MPKALALDEIDPIAEEVDTAMMESGEAAAIPSHKFDASGSFGDLSDGGRVGDVDVRPVGESGRVNFAKREPGRPTVRMVWKYDGTPSTIPIAYDPSGKNHDGGRKYLLKRHCTVCNFNGFTGRVCPACRKDGREIVPPQPLYYLRRELVPQPGRYFGAVDCFVPTCVRRGRHGFLDEAQMRQHAMGRHRMEYRAFQDSQQSMQASTIAQLQAQVMALTTAQLNSAPRPAPETAKPAVTPARQAYLDRMAQQRAAKREAAGSAA